MIGIGTKFIIRVILNGLGLYLATSYLPGFHLAGGMQALAVSSVVLALFFSIVHPILRLAAAPLIWITFGLFNIAISMALLWAADLALAELQIENITTLFFASLILAIVNVF